jgi:glycosyltransferase involved in cell wall biosynthesis
LTEFDEILVCDGNSTDGTLDIARRFGARIIKQADTDEPNFRLKDFAAARNKCIAEGKYDWNLYIDSDEELPARTAEEIRSIVTAPRIEHYVYKVPNKILYEGREIKYAVPYPGYQMRFLNRKCGAHHERSPHSRLVFDVTKYPVGYLKNPWYVIIEHGKRGYDPEINRGHIQLEIMSTLAMPFGHFMYWVVYKRLVGIVKLLIRTGWLYLRHGFKETLPPRIELLRIKYKWLVLWGALGARIRAH